MAQAFLVTSGEYSDYGIRAVFSTKELAENFISAFNNKTGYNEMSVEEWELDPAKEYLQVGRKAFFGRIDREGNTRDFENEDSAYGFDFRGESSVSYTADKEWLNVNCFATDEKHAIKIANEWRTQILALNKWGEPSNQ